MKDKIRLGLTVALVVTEITGFVLALNRTGIATMIYYTQQSNLIMLVSAIISLVVQILVMTEKLSDTPKWIVILDYVATSLISVTFFTVIFVLFPSYAVSGGLKGGASVFYVGSMLYHHSICPVLALILFVCFQKKGVLTLVHNLLAMSYTALYAIVTTSLNIAKVMEGPYPFLYVYRQPVWQSVMWFFAIPGCGYLFAYILRRINSRQ